VEGYLWRVEELQKSCGEQLAPGPERVLERPQELLALAAEELPRVAGS
jgi:hypothetical protein